MYTCMYISHASHVDHEKLIATAYTCLKLMHQSTVARDPASMTSRAMGISKEFRHL